MLCRRNVITGRRRGRCEFHKNVSVAEQKRSVVVRRVDVRDFVDMARFGRSRGILAPILMQLPP